MANIFGDTESIQLIQYMSKGTTINIETYFNTLKRLCRVIDKKRSNLSQSNVFLLHVNAPISLRLHWTWPMNYYLFRKLKKKTSKRKTFWKGQLHKFFFFRGIGSFRRNGVNALILMEIILKNKTVEKPYIFSFSIRPSHSTKYHKKYHFNSLIK